MTLEECQQHFAAWRSQKKSLREPIPEELWELAVELTDNHSQKKVASALSLNVNELSRRRKSPRRNNQEVSESKPHFIELELTGANLSGQCQRIEIERYDGHRMTLLAPPDNPFSIQDAMKLFLGGDDASSQRS